MYEVSVGVSESKVRICKKCILHPRVLSIDPITSAGPILAETENP